MKTEKSHHLLTACAVLILSAFIFCSCGSSGGSSAPKFAPHSSSTWTFMIYIGADNDLDGYDDTDISEMISGLSSSGNSYINVIVLQDKYGISNSAMYRITGSGKEQLDDGGTGTGHSAALGEVNTGDPDVLSNFIGHCLTNFPADRYMLVLWNHGSGSRKKSSLSDSSGLSKAVCEDETSSDILYTDEVGQAVGAHFSSSSKLDIIGYDACLMATAAVAYELKDTARYMCASMASEWAYGWDYETLFSAMTGGEGYSSSAETLAELTVWSFKESTSAYSDQTLSAVDLSEMGTLKSAVDSLAASMAAEGNQGGLESTRDSSYHFYTKASETDDFPYTDLGNFASRIESDGSYSSSLRSAAQSVLSALSDSVVYAYAGSDFGGYYGSGSSVKKGLSIFFSTGSSDYQYQWWYTSIDTASQYGASYLYGNLDFCTYDSDGTVETWKELMEFWYDNGNTLTADTW